MTNEKLLELAGRIFRTTRAQVGLAMQISDYARKTELIGTGLRQQLDGASRVADTDPAAPG